ncbi:MAG: sigma-54-dependent Fis family transcriptional regulator, partial [Deltaproteobacteria bacterium]|nr:sigma-54-dependent Fis family transcriptional regulator [Deltaproteobacteria bacterium]
MAEIKNILIIDDNRELVELLKIQLEAQGFEVVSSPTGRGGIEAVKEGFTGVILLDLKLPDQEGLEVFETIRRINSTIPVIIISAHGTINIAVEATKKGAFDFITKGDSLFVKRVSISVVNALKTLSLSEKILTLTSELQAKYSFDSIMTQSSAMRNVLNRLKDVLDSNVSVLIYGESGTGKELIARTIHFNSMRRDAPFKAINCAGIPETLLESEFFGYEKGAFTGATSRKLGKFEDANGGTVFLDEIGEMGKPLQAKLLRVLQERSFERLGGNELITVDARVVSATNKNLYEEVQKGTFREDLYYRISVFPVYLPPLREREGDIELLAHYFRDKFNKAEGKTIKGITERAMGALKSHKFPGNVRELENIISHAVLVCKSDEIDIYDLPFSRPQSNDENMGRGQAYSIPGAASPKDLEGAFAGLLGGIGNPPTLNEISASYVAAL